MAARWVLRRGPDLVLAPALEMTATARKSALPPHQATRAFESWHHEIRHQESVRSLLLEVLQGAGDSLFDWRRHTETEIRDRVSAHLRQGRLLLTQDKRRAQAPAPTAEPLDPVVLASKPAPKVAPDKSWIEVSLADQDGHPFDTRYVLELPDGKKREGQSAGGVIRADGIDPGSCRLSLPDLDAPAWSPS